MKDFVATLQNALPPVEYVKLKMEPDLYGASRLVSRKLHLPFTPLSFANWLHGWLSTDLKYIEQFGVLSNYKYLVATKEHEHFFRKNGKRSKAVGAPFICAKEFDKVEIKRKKNSLLVMPAHGLSYDEIRNFLEVVQSDICAREQTNP